MIKSHSDGPSKRVHYTPPALVSKSRIQKKSSKVDAVRLLSQIENEVIAVQSCVRINTHQSRQVSSQIRAVCYTLTKMQSSTPSPTLLSVLRAGIFLVEQMGEKERPPKTSRVALSATEIGPEQQPRSELDVGIPSSLLSSLHAYESESGSIFVDPAADLENLNGQRKGTSDNIEENISSATPLTPRWLFFLIRHFTCEMLFQAWQDRLDACWKLHSPVQTSKDQEFARRRDEEENARLIQQLGFRSLEVLSRFQRRYLNEESSPNGNQYEGRRSEATTSEIIAFYRDSSRMASLWRISYEDLDRALLLDERCKERRSTPVVPRMSARSGFFWHHIPMTVYELDISDLVASEVEPEAISETMMCFVQDATVRFRWIFPGLVRYWGAFTEKLCSKKDEEDTLSQPQKESTSSHAQHCVGCFLKGEKSALCQEFTPVKPVVWKREKASSVFSNPRICLGLVAEKLMQATVDSSGFSPLANYLYNPERSSVLPIFSPSEVVDIVLQMLDTVAYMEKDREKIPREVWAAWMSMSPFNVFINVTPLSTCASSLISPFQFFGRSTLAPPLHASSRPKPSIRRIEVKYAPPVYVPLAAINSWRPHPRARSVACYALAQLFLSLLTRQKPYKGRWKEGGLPEEEEEIEGCARKEGDVPGMSIHPSISPAGKALCERALSLQQSSNLMTLEQFKTGLIKWEEDELLRITYGRGSK